MRKRNRMIKIVALILVLALVLGVGVTTTLVLLFGSSPSVIGTYKASDSRTLKLEKNSVATLTVPSIQQPLTAAYKVENDTVTVYEPGATNQSITFTIDNGNLVTQDGATWVKQK